jgi:hypothetical protein
LAAADSQEIMEETGYRKNSNHLINEAILAAVFSISKQTLAGTVQKLQR